MTEANLLMSGKAQSSAPTLTDGNAYPLSMTTDARVRVDATGTVTISGTPAVSISGTPAVTATISGTPAVTVSSGVITATPAQGTGYALTTAATTNGNNIKNAAGSLYEIAAFNSSGATIYVKLYNKASAPTVGTDTPIMTYAVAAGALTNLNFGYIGKRFGTGISIAITGAAASSDTTAIAAGVLISATYM